uniref:C-type lectin domain-containing protein n=1 Tax=Erpetoichthys calabaricus TaxID=27687 RepID=A0A8C4REB3_ERPCA
MKAPGIQLVLYSWLVPFMFNTADIALKILSLIYERKFQAVSTNMSWLSALEYCNSNYSGMATIRSEREEWHLLKYLNGTNIQEKVWIGMRRSRVFGFWFWMNDDPVIYQNWLNDSSKNIQDDQNCATLDQNQTKWVKQDCAGPAPFVCYSGE